jgi:hypothetical protein
MGACSIGLERSVISRVDRIVADAPVLPPVVHVHVHGYDYSHFSPSSSQKSLYRVPTLPRTSFTLEAIARPEVFHSCPG